MGLPVSSESDPVRMFRLVLGQDRRLIAQRNQIEDRAGTVLKNHPDYQPVSSIHPLTHVNKCRRAADRRLPSNRPGGDFATIRSSTFRGQTTVGQRMVCTVHAVVKGPDRSVTKVPN